jgi:pyrroline-5-carboxylate reductase
MRAKKKKSAPKNNPGGALGFLGGGNMAEALIRGLLAAKVRNRRRIFVSDQLPERLAHLKKQFGIHVGTNRDVAASASVLILAVKPKDIAEVATEVRASLHHKHTLISIAAGVPLSRLQDLFPSIGAIVRTMPNTPALVGEGATGIFLHEDTPALKKLCESIFNAVGRSCFVQKEEQLHAVTALSGSGPAYVFLFLEALIEAGIGAGLAADQAKALALQTVVGAAKLAQVSEEDVRELRRRVTSPGGTTIEGIKVLEEGFWPQVVKRAVIAARDRSRQISKEMT